MGIRGEGEHQLLDKAHVGFGSGRNRQSQCIPRKWLAFVSLTAALVLASGCGGGSGQAETTITDAELVAKGKEIPLRYVGDESLWTDTLRMHEVIRTGVDPVTRYQWGSRSTPTRFLRWLSREFGMAVWI